MKKHLLIFAILTSMLSVVNVSQANANCTAENPCGTWAMLDSQGVVTNVIVCQASVCGGGTWAGQTVVPQVAPNPVTNHTNGSFIGNSEQGTEVKYSDGTFTITENATITKTSTEIGLETTTVSKVEIPVSQRSFTYEDTINKSNKNDIEMSSLIFNENNSTILTVTQTIVDTIDEENNIWYSASQESVIFNERKNQNEIAEVVSNNGLNLLLSKIQTLISLLGTWVK
jgi:hypothetical protein